jgi:arylsulfatase A-like enzyme
LAGEGVRFANCFTASPPCSPARGCIMTGRYAHSIGQVGLGHRGFELPAGQRTIVDYFNDAGYLTANIGVQHERRDPRQNRYQIDDHESGQCEVAARKAVAFLAERARDRAAPFYLNVGFHEVHLPFTRPEYAPDDPGSVCVPPWLPDNQGVREELARFNGAIRFMDQAVGLMVAAVDQSPLRENVLIMFTTDHGMAFPRAKGTLYDPGTGTALIMRMPPGEGRSGVVATELVSSIDIAPTLLAAAGIKPFAEMQGMSFLGLLTGQPGAVRDHVFSEKNYHDSYDPVRAVRTDRYKYLRNYECRRKIVLASDIKRSCGAVEMWPWANEARPTEELYDLVADPLEMENLADRGGLAGIRARLSRRLDRWMVETADPLLKGPVPAPPGARVDPPDLPSGCVAP